jgi:hypothetical protein
MCGEKKGRVWGHTEQAPAPSHQYEFASIPKFRALLRKYYTITFIKLVHIQSAGNPQPTNFPVLSGTPGHVPVEGLEVVWRIEG